MRPLVPVLAWSLLNRRSDEKSLNWLDFGWDHPTRSESWRCRKSDDLFIGPLAVAMPAIPTAFHKCERERLAARLWPEPPGQQHLACS